MSWFDKLRQRRQDHEAATENSRKLLHEALRTDPEVDELHREALVRLGQATEMARTLKATDRQNHYSESLTLAFRGRTAQ